MELWLVFVLAGAAVVLLLAVVLALALRRKTKRIGGVSLAAPGPFTIPFAPTAGPAEVWIRYSVSFPYERPPGAMTSRVFCLVVELVADGQKMTFGHGGRHPQGLLELEGLVHYMTTFAPGDPSTASRYSASVLVKKLPVCPRTLSGAVHVDRGTMLTSAELTLEA